MNEYELKLISNLLKRYAAELSNAGCNDMSESDWEGIPEEERQRIRLACGNHVDPENNPWPLDSDEWITDYLSDKIDDSLSFIPRSNFPS